MLFLNSLKNIIMLRFLSQVFVLNFVVRQSVETGEVFATLMTVLEMFWILVLCASWRHDISSQLGIMLKNCDTDQKW